MFWNDWMGANLFRPNRYQARSIGSFDLILIALLFGTTVTILSPAEVEALSGRDHAVLTRVVVFVLWLLLAVISICRGVYPLVMTWKRPLKGRILTAICMSFAVTCCAWLLPVQTLQMTFKVEHFWNLVRSLGLSKITIVKKPNVCVNVLYKNYAVLMPYQRFGSCDTRIIQYDTVDNPACKPQVGDKLADINSRPNGKVWSEMQVANSFTSLVTCSLF